jgi:hypothetical protein
MCPTKGIEMKIIAVITEDEPIHKILISALLLRLAR